MFKLVRRTTTISCDNIFCRASFRPLLAIGLVLKSNRRYSQAVKKAFHVSQATLDVGSIGEDDEAIIEVWLNTDGDDHLLCNLNKQTLQVPLDLAFTDGETVAFFSKGSGTVHLSGYLMPDDEFDFPPPEGDIDDERFVWCRIFGRFIACAFG